MKTILTLEKIGKIHIICGESLDEKSGKNEHIYLAIKLAGTKSYEDVSLIDDPSMNLCAAGSGNIKVMKFILMHLSYMMQKFHIGYIEEDDESTDYVSEDD